MNAAYTLTKSASSRVETVDGGWSSWKAQSDCASGCLFGEEGRLRSGSTGITIANRHCNNPRYFIYLYILTLILFVHATFYLLIRLVLLGIYL